jgi:uncharacterized protein
MGERTSHAPGTFSWVDLATTDAAGAKEFYGELFGWVAEDMPGEAGTYTMFRLDAKDVAACFAQGDGAPPHWNSYVTVEDVDASMEMAAELGGSVLMPAGDIEGIGRMAVIADPTGAAVALWEPRGHIGAGLVNAPGALCWNDLGTTDPDAAWAFYRELFGWTIRCSTGRSATGSRRTAASIARATRKAVGRRAGSSTSRQPTWKPPTRSSANSVGR